MSSRPAVYNDLRKDAICDKHAAGGGTRVLAEFAGGAPTRQHVPQLRGRVIAPSEQAFPVKQNSGGHTTATLATTALYRVACFSPHHSAVAFISAITPSSHNRTCMPVLRASAAFSSRSNLSASTAFCRAPERRLSCVRFLTSRRAKSQLSIYSSLRARYRENQS